MNHNNKHNRIISQMTKEGRRIFSDRFPFSYVLKVKTCIWKPYCPLATNNDESTQTSEIGEKTHLQIELLKSSECLIFNPFDRVTVQNRVLHTNHSIHEKKTTLELLLSMGKANTCLYLFKGLLKLYPTSHKVQIKQQKLKCKKPHHWN